MGTLALVLAVLLFLAFGWAFWRNTRPDGASRRWRLVLLVLQLVVAFLVATDLLVLVAVQVAFVLPDRKAFAWIGGQAVATVAAFLFLAFTRTFVPLPGLSHLPVPVSVGLTGLYHLIWQTFAFCAGYMAVTEARSRQELARVNAELQATHGLLADSHRLAERVRIARELHDTLGHHLTVLSVSLELAKQLADGKVAEAVREAQEVTRLLLFDVREVVSSLREERDLGLRTALEALVAGTPNPRVHLTLPDDLGIEDPAKAHALFRCAQEVLTNAVRHSQADNVWIDFTPKDSGVMLFARDDGRGVPEVTLGHGLTGMRERIEALGGRLKLDSGAEKGFAIAAWIPRRKAL